MTAAYPWSPDQQPTGLSPPSMREWPEAPNGSNGGDHRSIGSHFRRLRRNRKPRHGATLRRRDAPRTPVPRRLHRGRMNHRRMTPGLSQNAAGSVGHQSYELRQVQLTYLPAWLALAPTWVASAPRCPSWGRRLPRPSCRPSGHGGGHMGHSGGMGQIRQCR
jgi:hypothetical protein